VEFTIPAALDRAARLFPEHTAIAEPGRPRLTYSELRDRSLEVARALVAVGVQPGDRIAIWSPNTTEWILAALGCFCAGATLVPVNTRFTGHEALDVIGRSRARVLFVADWFLGADRLAQLLTALGDAEQSAERAEGGGSNELKVIVTIPVEQPPPVRDPARATAEVPLIPFAGLTARAGDVTADTVRRRLAAISPADVSDILFTSGTTGRSKGAMSSHAQALAVAEAWAECGQVTRADRYLVVNPFFHSFGYKAGILVCLLTGATIVPQLVYDAEQAMRLIEDERITVLPGAPTIYQTILDHPARRYFDLSSLRLAVTGAAVVPVALVERMQSELSFDVVLTAYGLTEAVVVTMGRPGDPPQTVATTSGRATAGFEIQIATTGEILLRGPNVMLGYLDDPAATKEAVDSGGWLHTGDVGRLDGEGNLTITDRLKDMYICGGFNVYPAEVEQVLARLPAVAESAVIGVPDGRLGEVGKAFVVTRPEEELTAAEVIAYCRERLANFKVPRQVEFLAALPRNPSGKALKRLLREESR
jgi:HIP---CoA ligase